MTEANPMSDNPMSTSNSPAIPLNLTTQPELEAQTLGDRIKAAQSRIAEQTGPTLAKAEEQARAAAGTAKQFVKDHPALAITGAIVAGAAIAFALPGKPGRKLRGSTMALGGLVAELAATYGSRMLSMAEEAAHTSQEKLGEIGESFAAAGGNIADSATGTGASILKSVKRAGEATASKAQTLASKIKR
ncbi:hypothetical protein EKN06_03135 [Croceicoccus ponticola]|uniref:Uncharacterized protein n=1 Tax=Croceicoccus ponticola TaxID=2217664 RepID=A0A437H0S5_9SPHN|nr:hypothetical protein [Croceicoccus ponticola]RVQ69208.1 hypothetical protein EKN06_03135 [Croceicoccus ponticola]